MTDLIIRRDTRTLKIASVGVGAGGGGRALGLTLLGGLGGIQAGDVFYVRCPFNGVINSWEIFADAVGSIVIDVWKGTYAELPLSVADTIAGSEKPTLAAAQTNRDLTLSTWTTTLLEGDWLAFKVESVSGLAQVYLSLKATRR